MKKEVGIAINPETPLEEMYSYIPDIHTALIMTVTPGKDGQVYESEMNDKVATLRVKFPSLPIEVDGGVNSSTIGGAKKAGANIFVAGSAIWRAEEPRDMFIRLQQSVH
jgi:ribulose-phosphate 3-epimerase